MDFTKQEKQVLVFLLAAAAIGTGIICYKSLTCQPKIGVSSRQRAPDEALIKEAKDYKIININTATKEELLRLKGIGPRLAEAILEYRASRGNFLTKEDIRNVKGIGPAKYDAIKENIKTE